ncbi:NeuD/PglB/VioB family sugar acetyltransferase [Halomonas maura]|uniref:NeuD/PglB/VioB family sugar acetyltransferase n=1 Tax=Halomonas maura TaxID=117606 RepID=UPI0025B4208A|nr:NeuD/PglB/VioB family sugar acetyltransferase [Halomonas maura]MDN3555245.1 NeuD/PglB/VioB family sugar acetyltransferase [Halomonas maura]
MDEFCVVGGGGHARVLIHALRRLGHRVRGYVAPYDEGEVLGVPFLGTDSDLLIQARMLPSLAVLGMGKVTVATPRLAILEAYRAHGLQFPVISAPGAMIHEGVSCGLGSVVLDGAVVVTGTCLGRACIVNTNATVDHGCTLGDDVHVAPGATISGGVNIGDRCMIGTGASLVHAVRVCADCLIGAGATVVRDIDMPGTYVGTPARRIA